MARINLSRSEGIRDNLTAQQEREIRALYRRLAEQAHAQAERLRDVDGSAQLERQRLETLAGQLASSHNEISRKLMETIPANMQQAADALRGDTDRWLAQFGVDVTGLMSNVPTAVVEMVMTGQVYKPLPNGQNWTASGAIWGNANSVQQELNRVVAEGIAANKSTYEIAKALEQYVDPSSVKPWDWSKVYPGTRKQVDYNAQRLARTLVSHAYQAMFVASTKPNPFVSGYIWHTANSHRVCPICEELDGQHFGKSELPLDHPNGMCYWEAVVPDLEEVGARLGAWVRGANDPTIDNYMSYMYGNIQDVVRTTANAFRREGPITLEKAQRHSAD